jgi:exonuclease VII large subunit
MSQSGWKHEEVKDTIKNMATTKLGQLQEALEGTRSRMKAGTGKFRKELQRDIPTERRKS